MHWRLNVMSGLLHPTVKRPDARWRLSVDEVARAASDVDVIKCTDGCLDVKETAPDLERSNALTRLSVMSDDCIRFRTIRCTDDFVCDQNCCIRYWNHRVHWRNCLIIRLLHPTVKRSDARWRLSVAKVRWSDVFRDECRGAASDVDVIKCTLTVVSMSERLHLISNDQMHWRFCLFFRNVETQRLSVDADKTSDACWNCRLTDWLQSKFLTWWRKLNVRCSLSLIANDFFRLQTIFSSSFLTFFEL